MPKNLDFVGSRPKSASFRVIMITLGVRLGITFPIAALRGLVLAADELAVPPIGITERRQQCRDSIYQ